MRYPNLKKYPKTIRVNGARYNIRFVEAIDNEGTMGICESGTYDNGRIRPKYIKIKLNLTPKETFETFIHELLHAIESEYKIRIKHKLVYRLEEPLATVLLNNFIFKFKRQRK